MCQLLKNKLNMEKEVININGEMYEKDFVVQKTTEIVKKYDKELYDLFCDVIQKRVNTYKRLIEKIEILDMHFNDEMMEWGQPADNSVICMKETAQRAHDNDENIQDFAEEMVMMFKAAGSVRFWTNAKGQRCDEYGNLLSEDGEHRVFDIIKTDE